MENTKKQIREWQRRIESYTGMDCPALSSLKSNASLKEMIEAQATDKQMWKSYVNDLELLL